MIVLYWLKSALSAGAVIAGVMCVLCVVLKGFNDPMSFWFAATAAAAWGVGEIVELILVYAAERPIGVMEKSEEDDGIEEQG